MTDTLFMIHGMWGAPCYWDNYRSVFEKEGYRCIATTLPYHDMDPQALPDPRLGTTSLLEYADALEQEIRRLGIKPILMGHSMGGLLAQILAERNLAKAVVLVSPAAPAGIFAVTPSGIKSFWSIQTQWGFWKKPMRQPFNEAAYSILNLLPENEQKEAYARFVYESGRTIFEIGLWQFDTSHASRVDASKVTCPMLIVTGTEDRIVPTSVVRKIAKRYSAISTYKEFENHAHWMVTEPNWQEVPEYINDWLRNTLK